MRVTYPMSPTTQTPSIDTGSPRLGRALVLVFSLFVFACMLAVPVAFAADGYAGEDAPPAEDSWGYALAHELMSPFCPGRTLAACPSPNATELRMWIVMQEAAGATQAEVMEDLIARFGDVIRSEPKQEGWGILAYLFPAFLIFGGLGVVAVVFRRIARPSDGGGQPTPTVASSTFTPSAATPGTLADDELSSIIDAELADL